MTNIEKRHIIDSSNLKENAYFTSLLQEAYASGLISDSDMENVQLQCLQLLSYKCERYTSGDSSSVRVEIAESIMKSNLYTISVYLKSLPDVEDAVNEIIKVPISELYQKGRKQIDIKFHTAEHIYRLVQKNKITTKNYSYNATISDDGIGLFFSSYRPDYEAHGAPASIDYQLCNQVYGLEGVEFIQQYLSNLFIENEFCSYFESDKIHYLLSGCDENYKDLLINVFEQVLVGSIGCSLASRNIVSLVISESDVHQIHSFLKDTGNKLDFEIQKAAVKVIQGLNITSVPVRKYIEKSLPKIIADIRSAVNLNTLKKVLVTSKNIDLPKIEFISAVKMKDEDYWKIVNELAMCRYSADRLAIIKQKIKSFRDIERILSDADLDEKEMYCVFRMLGSIELATLIKRHPFSNFDRDEILSEEFTLRMYLQNFFYKMPLERQMRIEQIIDRLEQESK